MQFDHRMLGYAVVLAALGQVLWLAAKARAAALIGSALTLALFAVLQATLGVWTLLLAVPITLGLAHQAGAIAVFAAALYHFWLARRSLDARRARSDRGERLIEIGDDVARHPRARPTAAPPPARRPRADRCSSVSWRCVVEAGWMIRLRVSPILARWLNSLTLLTSAMPAS